MFNDIIKKKKIVSAEKEVKKILKDAEKIQKKINKIWNLEKHKKKGEKKNV